MARGFLQGVVFGSVVSTTVAIVGSILLPPPLPPQVSDAAPGAAQAPVGMDTASTAKDASLSDPALDLGQAAPQTPAPDPDTLSVLDAETTSPAALPQTGAAEGLTTPGSQPDSGGIVAGSDDPVLPNPQALAPMAPQEADTLSISTEPAQPPAPEAEDAPFASPAETATTDLPAESVAPQVTADAPEAPTAPEPSEAQSTDIAQTEPDQAPQVALAEPPAPDTPQSPVTEPAPLAPPVAAAPAQQDTPAAQAPAETEAAESQEAAAEAEQTASARPQIGTPAVSLTNRQNGVTINRPTNAASEPEVVAAQAEAAQADVTLEDLLPPLQAFAQPFERPGNKPLMGIILIDDGKQLTSGAQGIAALRSFPYPLSFAVDASMADAAERVALYRAAGFEVLAMIELPPGAQPSDAETTFNVLLPPLKEVVGVLEGPTAGFQGGKEVSDQVTAILAAGGYGLVTQDKGLNTMPKLARKEGVPADPIFRDFDSKGQNAAVIRRFLDQAAFKAGQEGAVIMLGRLRPDTISALLLWGLQDRASSVALAPISAVLTRAD